MLHGIRISGGRAEWFKSSWVRTSAFDSGQPFSFLEDGTLDRLASLANTHVICHAGRMLALYEQSFPTEVTPELETVGPFDFGGRLSTGVTAHPKRCPLTGELLFFGYDASPPYLTYHRVTEGGELAQSEHIAVPGPTMIHDFAVTATHVVWMDLPIVFDVNLAVQGRFPYIWSDTYGARLGLMPRTGGNADVRWFDIDPCYVFHTANAHESENADTITLDGARYPELWRGAPEGFDQPASLWRWTIHAGRGTISEQQLDDQPCEFPRVDPRRVGLANRYTWLATTDSRLSEDFGHSILKFDASTGRAEPYALSPAESPSEPVFVPASAASGEDEGWLLSYVYDRTSDRSHLLVLDAHDWGAAPLARVQLPTRVPYGFHGSWIGDDELSP
jgi:carotenoid cleavage dioxygenase